MSNTIVSSVDIGSMDLSRVHFSLTLTLFLYKESYAFQNS